MALEKWFKEQLELFKNDFDFRLEAIILNLTEQICGNMLDAKITRSALAERLEVSPAAITKILNGTSNFTLRTLLSLADALELELNIGFREKQIVSVYGTLTSSASESEMPVIAGEDYIIPDANTFLSTKHEYLTATT